jgi:hypothetical protein
MSTAGATLLELQMQFRRAILGGEIGDIATAAESDGIDAAARVRIYRNHFLATLGAALKATFPVVCRLVDERFFAYAVDEYLREYPPHSRCLSEYGADLAEFLAAFEPCKDLPYLADIARFEWALNASAMVREAASLPTGALAAIPAERMAYVGFRLQPSVRYLSSPWPVDAIWRANQQHEVPSIDLAGGEAHLEIRRAGETVVWRRLDAGSFAFRSALAENLVLAAAITAALSRDPAFDPAPALQLVLTEGLAVDVDFVPKEA